MGHWRTHPCLLASGNAVLGWAQRPTPRPVPPPPRRAAPAGARGPDGGGQLWRAAGAVALLHVGSRPGPAAARHPQAHPQLRQLQGALCCALCCAVPCCAALCHAARALQPGPAAFAVRRCAPAAPAPRCTCAAARHRRPGEAHHHRLHLGRRGRGRAPAGAHPWAGPVWEGLGVEATRCTSALLPTLAPCLSTPPALSSLRSCWGTSCRTCPLWITTPCTSGCRTAARRSASHRRAPPCGLACPRCPRSLGAPACLPAPRTGRPPRPPRPQRVTVPRPCRVQAWLRRAPKPWATPLADRLAAHEDYMLADLVGGWVRGLLVCRGLCISRVHPSCVSCPSPPVWCARRRSTATSHLTLPHQPCPSPWRRRMRWWTAPLTTPTGWACARWALKPAVHACSSCREAWLPAAPTRVPHLPPTTLAGACPAVSPQMGKWRLLSSKNPLRPSKKGGLRDDGQQEGAAAGQEGARTPPSRQPANPPKTHAACPVYLYLRRQPRL